MKKRRGNGQTSNGYTIGQSLRFSSASSSYLTRTPAAAGSKTAWSISLWVKLGGATTGSLFHALTNATSNYADYINFNSDGTIRWRVVDTSNTSIGDLAINQVFRDYSGWYHFVFVWDSNNATSTDRMRAYVNGQRITSYTYNTTPAQGAQSIGTNQATRHCFGSTSYNTPTNFFDGYLAEIYLIDGAALDPSYFGQTDSNTGQWIPKNFTGTSTVPVLAFVPAATGTIIGNLTDGGLPLSSVFDGNYSKANPSLAYLSATAPGYAGKDWGAVVTKTIGKAVAYGSNNYGFYNSGYNVTLTLQGSTDNFSSSIVDLGSLTFADDGTNTPRTITASTLAPYRYHRIKIVTAYGAEKLAQLEFFEVTSYGSYGTNGFYLPFSSATAVNGSGTKSGGTLAGLGADFSGNNNHWTASGLNTYDQVLDSPTNNFCTFVTAKLWNIVPTVSYANLQINGGDNGAIISGPWSSSGKWYAECQVIAVGSVSYVGIGDYTTLNQAADSNNIVYQSGGLIYKYGSSLGSFGTYTSGDTIGIALDLDALQVSFYKNGSLIQTVSGVNGFYLYGFNNAFANPGSKTHVWNFGQGGQSGLTHNSASGGRFKYTPPTGFKALCTANLSAPTIKNPSQYFNALLWTGDGAASRTLAGLGFQPDFVWAKSRTLARNHWFADSVRGANLDLSSNLADGEYNVVSGTNNGGIGAIASNGFTVVSGTTDNSNLNSSGATQVAWCWKKGSATTGPGFDVVTYSGTGSNRTVNHSLGAIPKLMIIKDRQNTRDWAVYHSAIGAGNYLALNLTAASGPGSTYFNSTDPTSSVFTVGTTAVVNGSGISYIAYLWAEVGGFSKFGSYTGNGAADGPFVYCGFKPRWVMLKSVTTGSAGFDWYIYDSARSTLNPIWLDLRANQSVSEDSGALGLGPIDFVSNGFKMRSSVATNYVNQSGDTYIFAAFAEAPFKYATAR